MAREVDTGGDEMDESLRSIFFQDQERLWLLEFNAHSD